MKPIEQGWVLRDSSFMGATTHDPWLVRQWSPGRQDSGSGQRQNRTLQSPSLCQAVPVPAYCCKDWLIFKKTLFVCPLPNLKKKKYLESCTFSSVNQEKANKPFFKSGLVQIFLNLTNINNCLLLALREEAGDCK